MIFKKLKHFVLMSTLFSILLGISESAFANYSSSNFWKRIWNPFKNFSEVVPEVVLEAKVTSIDLNNN